MDVYFFRLIAFTLLSAFSNYSFSQEDLIASENKTCLFDRTELDLRLNGWDFDRTDFTHENFKSVLGDLIIGFDFEGDQDQIEFGYPWHYYNDGKSRITFAGNQDKQGKYIDGSNTLWSFELLDASFNVNGISVGQPIDLVYQTFGKERVCKKPEKSLVTIYYGWQSLYFVYDSNKMISEIGLYSPL
jgi:hypothetical protein